MAVNGSGDSPGDGSGDSAEDGAEGPSRTGAQAVERAVALVATFADGAESLGLGELAAHTGLRPSTAHRIVRALVRGGVLEQDPATERYQLGRTMAVLGQAALQTYGFVAAQPLLDGLATTSGESASLAVRDGADVVVVLKAASHQPLRFDQPLGTRLAAHASAMGKACLALSGRDVAAAVTALGPLGAFTPATVTDVAQLVDELAVARAAGYAVNRQERFDGVCGVAAPVLDRTGRAKGAVGVRGPAIRFDEERIAALGALVAAVAAEVSAVAAVDLF